MSVRASKIEARTAKAALNINTSSSPAEAVRARSTPTGVRRSLGAVASIPLVLVSTIAIALNIATPAHAATAQKKPLKTRTTLPQTAVKPIQALQPVTAVAAPTQYTVVDGDTVSAIAGRFGLSTASVLALNGLGWTATIFPGQVLTLSATEVVAAPAAAPVSAEITRYTIQSGDTLGGIAAAHGISTASVFSANGLGENSIIFPGQTIVLPGAGSAAVSSVAAVTAVIKPSATSGTHTVVAGDTIDKIAGSAGVSVQSVLEANGLGWSSIIFPGQTITLPGAAPVLESSPAMLVTPTPISNDGAVTTLTDEMAGNARVIISVGRDAGASDEALVVALAAAAQESGLRNVDYGDRDSLGLFQQRPSSGWGTEDEVMDPHRAARAFFGGPVNPNPGVTRGLLDIPDWEAAQAVQISGHPDLYAKWEASARSWLAQLA
jgi:LysM repeat protein